MDKGRNWIVESIFNGSLGISREEINCYVEEVLTKEFKTFRNREEIDASLGQDVDLFLEKISYEDIDAIRRYTGFDFRYVNAVLRNNWTYEILGEEKNEKKEEYEQEAKLIERALFKTCPLKIGIKAYRGVGLSFFYPYNITSLKDLAYLDGQYLCDFGFTSTTLLREKSFFSHSPEWGCANIEMEIFIPEGSDDGVWLGNDALSVSPEQSEFLINSTSLYKVVDVKIDEANNRALLKVVLVPSKVWNLSDYEKRSVEVR